MSQFEYDAFVSYRRSDGGVVARWLRRELERFRLPRSLRRTYGRKLRIYVDTAYERGTSDFYNQNIKPALLASRYLLVVATPDAARRESGADWIENEVRDFSAGPNGQNVIAVRGGGESEAQLPANLQQTFPNIEIVDLRGAGRFWYLNPIRAVRLSSEKLKLVAPLLGIPPGEMPRLRQEEDKRQQSRFGAVVGATLGVIVAVGGLSIFALQSRNDAIRAAEDAMFAVGGMAQQASYLDVNDEATTRTRRLIINRGCDLVDKFSLGAVSEPQIDDVILCRLERASAYEGLTEFNEARRQYDDAIRLAGIRHERLGRVDAGRGLLRAREAYARFHKRQKDFAAAEAEYTRLQADAQRIGNTNQGRREITEFEAEASGQLGDFEAGRNERAKAAASYAAAAAAVHLMLTEKTSEDRQPEPRVVAWLVRLHRLTGDQMTKQDKDDEAAGFFEKSLAVPERIGLKPLPLQVEYEIAVTNALLYALEIRRGNPSAGAKAKSAALQGIEVIEKSKVASTSLKQRSANIRNWMEEQALGQ